MQFRILWLLMAILASIGWGTGALADESCRTSEARALWVVRWEAMTPEQIKQVVAYAKDNNFNILVVQVRGRGDAYYKSNFEPRSETLEDQPADYDPLAVFVEEGHKAGLQIHAWLNTHYTWSGTTLPKSPDHIVNKHPEWLARTIENKVDMIPNDACEGAYTCPSNPEVKEHIRNVFLDIVKNYDVDGVHFDFVRYPNENYCYCDGCLARFKEWMDKELSPERIAALSADKDRLAYTKAYPEKWNHFRRKQIADLVGQVSRRAHDMKPQIIVSAAVFPGYKDACDYRFQDWKLWFKMGIIDVLYPMAYSTSMDLFTKRIGDAVDSSNGRHVYAGIGQYLNTFEGTVEKIEKARELGAQGVCLFSYGSATKDGTTGEILAQLKEAVFPEPASVPEMEWIQSR